MEQLNLNIVEPGQKINVHEGIGFNGKNRLSIKGGSAARMNLQREDEYIILATLGSDIYIAKKEPGDNHFGFLARRQKTGRSYAITTKDLREKVGFAKGTYRLGESFAQSGLLWFKLEKVN